MKYVKKPIVIEAIQWTGGNSQELLDWAGDSVVPERWYIKLDDESSILNGTHIDIGLRIHTLEGIMNASIGDYIVRGIDGEFYPCKESIFLKTYDKVEE